MVWWGFILFCLDFVLFPFEAFFLHVNEKYVFLTAIVNLKNYQEIYPLVAFTGMLPPMQDVTRLLPQLKFCWINFLLTRSPLPEVNTLVNR